MSEQNIDKPSQVSTKRSYFKKAFSTPFKMCWEHLLQFFIWGMFVLLGGQLGTLINIVQRVGFNDWTIGQSLCADSSSGNFYTFSLVTFAAILAPIFSKMIDKQKYPHRKIGVTFITVLFFPMVFCAVFFGASVNNNLLFEEFHKIENIKIDWPQLLFFLFSILCACYSFGYSKLDEHEPGLGLTDEPSYNLVEDKKVETISYAATQQTEDGNGNRL